MSGVFWEPEKQPNLCEAASGFTLSTVNLMVAIPMAAVDSLVAVTIFLSTTVWTLLGPVMEYLVSGLLMVMELLGLERFSPEQTIIAVVGVTSLLTIYKQFSGQKGWKEKMFCSLVTHVEGWLLLFSLLALPALDKAVFANVVTLGLALQLAKYCVAALFTAYYNHALQRKPNEMDKFATGMKNALDIESSLALLVAAFGYPSFSGADEVTAYLCLVPAVALHLVLQAEILPHVAPEDQVDCPNGAAVAVAEAPSAEETVLEKDLKEPAEAEAVSDEVVPEASADAAGDGSTVEAIEDQKTEAMIRRLQGCVAGIYSWLAAKVLLVISPVCQLISKLVTAVTSLPWASISLLTFSTASALLYAAAWHQLTSNSLALLLPVCSLVVPAALERMTAIPAQWRPYISHLNGLAHGVLQCLVITGGAVEQE